MISTTINIYNYNGQTAIHTYSMSHHCIPKKLRFGAIYGTAASLDRTSSVMIKTVNGNRYYAIITECFWPQSDDMDLEDMWFQQDGVTSHTANVTI